MRATDRLCPEGRTSDPVMVKDGRRVVCLDTFNAGLLGRIDTAVSRGAALDLRREVAIDRVESRVMAMLAIEPRIHAVRTCDVTSSDRGQVSRALAGLHARGMVDCDLVGAEVRKTKWWLAEQGYARHDRLFAVALARDERSIRGCDPQDLEVVLHVARIMVRKVDDL